MVEEQKASGAGTPRLGGVLSLWVYVRGPDRTDERREWELGAKKAAGETLRELRKRLTEAGYSVGSADGYFDVPGGA